MSRRDTLKSGLFNIMWQVLGLIHKVVGKSMP